MPDQSATTVLVVDDDPVFLQLLSRSVGAAGYEVEKARNGEEAWQRLQKGDIKLVVTDWEMPAMTGIELCRQIRSAGLPGYVYVVLVTSHDSIDDIVAGLDAGADDFISKPFNVAELQVRLRSGMRVLALETRDLAIFAMAKLAESRDPDTGAHLERICAYCQIVTAHLLKDAQCGFDIRPSFVQTIVQTSPLHDIGKVGIPDSVLRKPGRLNKEEFAVLQQHTVIGAQTLKAALDQYPNAEFLSMAYDIALCHHERYDGSGYPNGLKGDKIPLAARIVALADVYDALTSKRCYKEAFSHMVTRDIIIDSAGTHFDPRLIMAFEACEDQMIETKNRINASELSQS
ncbi:MAG: response regulator [Candidatus Hydrogenedentes bacterium]|nr:response regulator [Candidatus Hydrogenedentota bacterium]